jgi:hypothetical protein
VDIGHRRQEVPLVAGQDEQRVLVVQHRLAGVAEEQGDVQRGAVEGDGHDQQPQAEGHGQGDGQGRPEAPAAAGHTAEHGHGGDRRQHGQEDQ